MQRAACHNGPHVTGRKDGTSGVTQDFGGCDEIFFWHYDYHQSATAFGGMIQIIAATPASLRLGLPLHWAKKHEETYFPVLPEIQEILDAVYML